MASGSANGVRHGEAKVLCRYFVHGVCRYGDHCRFSHDLRDQQNLVCTFHKKGKCTYGKECRYDHIREKKVLPKPGGAAAVRKPKSVSEISISSHDESWAEAAAFVPGQTYSPRATASYSGAVKSSDQSNADSNSVNGLASGDKQEELCPFYLLGDCRYGEECLYVHGSLCDMCGLWILHPHDVVQQEKHKEECLASHEEDMKESFKVSQSRDVSCGICMEVVWEKKEKRDRKFGILENCTHAFCLECIRKWRSAKSFQHTVVRACPECRVSSSFVTPSENWVTDPEDKKNLIEGYKEHLSKTPCKHFNQGRGSCPFGANCFYLHAYPDGTKQDRSKIPKRAKNSEGRWQNLAASTLWDFIAERDDPSEYDDGSLDIFDLVYLLGAYSPRHDDQDAIDWFSDDTDSDEYYTRMSRSSDDDTLL